MSYGQWKEHPEVSSSPRKQNRNQKIDEENEPSPEIEISLGGNVSIWLLWALAWLVRLGFATESFRKLIWLWLNIAILYYAPYHTPPAIINKFPLLTRVLSITTKKNVPNWSGGRSVSGRGWWPEKVQHWAAQKRICAINASTRKKWNMDLERKTLVCSACTIY